MKRIYRVEVDCANCAAKMERAIRAIEGIREASLSFMTQKLSVEFEEDADIEAVMKNALRSCKRVESDCEIYL